MGIIITLLVSAWLLFIAYQTIVESKEGKTKRNVKILVGVLALLIVSNIFLVRSSSQYREYMSQREFENRHYIWVISLHTEYVADKIDAFLASVDDMEEGLSSDIHANWSAVLRQSDDISFNTGRISYEYMGELEQEWRDLEYILSQLKHTLFSINRKFLEHGSYSLTEGEREKMEAISRACRIIHEGVEIQRDIEFETGLIETLEQPMLIINPYYTRFSER